MFVNKRRGKFLTRDAFDGKYAIFTENSAKEEEEEGLHLYTEEKNDFYQEICLQESNRSTCASVTYTHTHIEFDFQIFGLVSIALVSVLINTWRERK